MSRCSWNSGRIKMIRGVAADVRYVGICDDCGIRTAPTSIALARLALDNHRRFAEAHAADREAAYAAVEAEVGPPTPVACVCWDCAPAHAAARAADLAAEIEASLAALPEASRRRRS